MPRDGLIAEQRGGKGPLAPFGRRLAAVVANRRIGAYNLISCADPSGPKPRAGQFYMLATEARWGGGEDGRPFLPRAFSVFRHSQPESGDGTLLEFILEVVGPGTERLTEVEQGENLWLLGPLGNGFHLPENGDAVLVGGGVGIAPLAALQDEVSPAKAPLLLGFRDQPHAESAGLLSDAQVATDDGSVGHHGLVTDLLSQHLVSSESRPTVYACGPPQMLEAVRAICAEREVPVQLALESPMACGYGACFGCVVPTVNGYIRLCVDGPVLNGSELETCLIPGAGH